VINLLTNLTDNNLATFVTLSNSLALWIDMGQTNVVDRIFLIGSTNKLNFWPDSNQNATNPPLGLIVVSVGNSGPGMTPVGAWTVPYDAGNPVDTEMDLRFSPTAGRYVQAQLQTNVTWGVNYWPGYALSSQPPAPTNLTWNVGQIELYGFSGPATSAVNAVVCDSTNQPLQLAALDLSYYLGELAGTPHPIITSAQTNLYPGTIYRVIDLSPLAPDYNTMMANIASGALPTNLVVSPVGREVQYSGWPYRCVLWGVWEFLDRQGVRWLYPLDEHADYVPVGHGVSTNMLPLSYIPSASEIQMDFTTDNFQPWPINVLQSLRQGYLNLWRNHWTVQAGTYGPCGGAQLGAWFYSEIPAQTPPGNLSTNWGEGFSGYPSNFGAVVPNWKLLQMGTSWWGATNCTGCASNPAPVYPGSILITWAMNNPALINWVAAKMVAYDAAYPLASQAPLDLRLKNNWYGLLPVDMTLWSQDSWDIAANGPYQPVGDAWMGCESTQSFSGAYYSFVTGVANQVSAQGLTAPVGALAYTDVYEPPVNISTFPSNVEVELCMYGSPSLSITSPANANLKMAWDTWHSKCSRLFTFDYTLYTELAATNSGFPLPLVAGMVDHAQYLAGIGALNTDSEANDTTLSDFVQHSPWNFYSYPRIRWNRNQTAKALETEFFSGYYREAAAPMLAYYQTLENQVYPSGGDFHRVHSYSYKIPAGVFTSLAPLYTMQTNLANAAAMATNWLTQLRVADASNGFAWVIAQEGLAGVNLNDLSSYQQIGGSPVTLNLTNFIALPTFAGSGGVVSGNEAVFTPNTPKWGLADNDSSFQTTLNLLQTGIYSVAVSVQALYSNYPTNVLTVTLGSQTTNITVCCQDPVWRTYTAVFSEPAGGQVLVVDDFENFTWDIGIGAGDDMAINQIQISKQ
jgi:hypothetical protein